MCKHLKRFQPSAIELMIVSMICPLKPIHLWQNLRRYGPRVLRD
jgi:hypothetical protein